MPATITPTSACAPTPDLLEEHRNHHRYKAHALLRLTEAVEDSNQRRRRASAAAAKATIKDLGLLSHDLQSQVASLNKQPKPALPSTLTKTTTTLTSPNAVDASTIEAVNKDIQNIVSALYQLRENAHLQYQILEMKYFELKRHAFDMEHQNRKLQLQLSSNTSSNATTDTTVLLVEQQQHDDDASISILEAQQLARQEELMAQLNTENHDLRKQLRETVSECRKMVQENYGLRRILLNAGVHWNRSAEISYKDATEAECKEADHGDDDNVFDGSETRMEDFQDAHEEFFDAIPEETTNDVLAEDGSNKSNNNHNKSSSNNHNNNIKEKEISKPVVVTDDEGATTDTTILEESSIGEEKEDDDEATTQQQGKTEKKNESFLPKIDKNRSSTPTPSSTGTFTPTTTSPASLSRGDISMDSSMNSSVADSTTTPNGTIIPGTQRKRSSRKSATFAAMAARLHQANSHGSSFSSSFRHDDNDNDSVSVATNNTIDRIKSMQHSYDQLQKERSLGLRLAAPLKVSSSVPSTLSSNTAGMRSIGRPAAPQSQPQPQPKPQETHPNPLHHRRMSTNSSASQASTSRRQHRQGDYSSSSSHNNNSSSSSKNNNNRTFKPSNQAITAKELMRQQKTGKKAITAKELMRAKQGPDEQRLSALLGGFRSGSSSVVATSSDDSSPHVGTLSALGGGGGGSTSSSSKRPSFFGRRRKSYQGQRDQHNHNNFNNDDESVTSTKSLGFMFRKPSSKRRIHS